MACTKGVRLGTAILFTQGAIPPISSVRAANRSPPTENTSRFHDCFAATDFSWCFEALSTIYHPQRFAAGTDSTFRQTPSTQSRPFPRGARSDSPRGRVLLREESFRKTMSVRRLGTELAAEHIGSVPLP